MNDWDFSPPPLSHMGDHDVDRDGIHLENKRVALLITGGIATIKAPFIARALRRQGADVVVYATEEALRYTTVDALEWSSVNGVVTRLTSASEHLSDNSPFDAYLVAPATYNTINKVAQGIADNPVTAAMSSALGRMERGMASILMAPTMHGSMHNSILTGSLKRLHSMGVRIVPPRESYGKHNIPNERVLVAEVCRTISTSPLKGKKILVTGGPTPVKIDNVRRITSRFRGRLGIEMARELFFHGADVKLIHGDGAVMPPSCVPCLVAKTYEDYRSMVHDELKGGGFDFGIFSAAVADCMPVEVKDGKIPGGTLEKIDLKPAAKIIDEVRSNYPHLTMITFKYQENLTHDELMSIARKRLESGDIAIVANRGEETGPAGEQVAWLVTGGNEPQRLLGKSGIAKGIAVFLENL